MELAPPRSLPETQGEAGLLHMPLCGVRCADVCAHASGRPASTCACVSERAVCVRLPGACLCVCARAFVCEGRVCVSGLCVPLYACLALSWLLKAVSPLMTENVFWAPSKSGPVTTPQLTLYCYIT